MPMQQTQKFLTVGLWLAVVLGAAGVIALQSARSRASKEAAAAASAGIVLDERSAAPGSTNGSGSVIAAKTQMPRAGLPNEKFEPLFDAASFQLIDQNGKSLATTDLRGSVWIADFIFTHCAGPCPIMTGKMADLQKAVRRPDVKLISFSVDPERDTPPVLKEYADRFGADHSRWFFLTGRKADIFDVAASMKIVAKPAAGEEPIMHSTRFLLIDQKGNVVGLYDSKSEDEMQQLVADAGALADRK